MYNVLILGGSGFEGKAIINEMNKSKEFLVNTTFFKSPIPINEHRSFNLDLEDLTNISLLLNTLKPQIIVSCLRGDFNKQLIFHIKIAEYLKEYGGKLYFLSTTNVFDNDLTKSHYEDDLTDSCTDYGQYKIACEKRMIEILKDNVCILRLPQVWGKDSSRMNQLLNSLRNNEKVVVYPNVFFNTNTDIVVARQLCYIIEHNLKGIFHLTSEDVIKQKDFYKELIIGLGFNNASIQENYEEVGCFAILSKRYNEFPRLLRVANKLVIDYLIS